MNEYKKNPVLRYEELKAVKFFVWTFYIILLPYDLTYYYLMPYLSDEKIGLPEGGMGFFFHLSLFALLPAALYLSKKGHTEFIKYMYFIGFILADTLNNIMIYWGTDKEFNSGHMLEVYFILFSPIFVNKRFFWTMTIGFFLKYSFMGIIFQSHKVVFVYGLIFFIGAIAWILLSRFQSYINAINAMNEDLRQKEKLAVIGQMATAIAHEIKNPLSSLKGFTQLQQEKDKEDDQYFPIMLNEIDRINGIVNDLLIIGKPNTGVKDNKKLSTMITYVTSFIAPHSSRRGINFEIAVDERSTIYCDENQLKQVFINVIKNAIEAMPDGGTIRIYSDRNDNWVNIHVEDDGCGIAQDKLTKLGEPFYTTKENGTGLGLMVTKKIIEEHGGMFEIESNLGVGTVVTIKLPLVHPN